jgi:hypothetical protein
MSFRSLLVHRVTVKRGAQTDIDGVPSYDWRDASTGVPCRVDLSFVRSGKDPLQWTPEAGRAKDRTGVAFFLPTADVMVGDRIVVTRGPSGTFLVEGTFEEILGRHGRVHHIELGIKEVAAARARGSV